MAERRRAGRSRLSVERASSARPRSSSAPVSAARRTRLSAKTPLAFGTASSCEGCGRTTSGSAFCGRHGEDAGVGDEDSRASTPGARRGRGRDRRPRRSPRGAPAPPASSRRGRARSPGRSAARRARSARGARRGSSARRRSEGRRRASSIHSGRSSASAARTSAAIISPFQSASTLSSRPGRTRLAPGGRGACRACRRAALRASGSALQPERSRLRMLVSSQLPCSVTS